MAFMKCIKCNVNLDPEASLFSHNVFSPRYRKRRIENHGRISEQILSPKTK